MNPVNPQEVKPVNVKAKKSKSILRQKIDPATQQTVKNDVIVNGNPSKQNENVKKKKKNKKKNAKKPKDTKSKSEVPNNGTIKLSSGFTMTDITNNAEASKLITELVNCYTSNLKLSPSELKSLNSSLHQKTASVFMNMLNGCIARVLKKLQESNFSPGLATKKKVNDENSSCQTKICLNIKCNCLANKSSGCPTQTSSSKMKNSSCQTKKPTFFTRNSSCQTKKL